MMSLFHEYFLAFLHPFKNQEALRLIRDRAMDVSGTRPLRLAGDLFEEDEIPTSGELEQASSLDFVEVLGMSWFFAAIEGFYAILALHLGQVFFQSWSTPNDLALLLPIETTMYTQRVLLTAALAKVVFFPLIFWFYAKFWKVLIKFFAGLFQVAGDLNKIVDQVVNQSMTAHFMLSVPIFGRMLRHLFGLLHLFAGLRNNLQMSVLQSVVIILSPAIIMTMITSFFMVSILYLSSVSF
ncbi:MAG: hypothetical protein COW01_16170 [Bdellovibrionales bacterium CG12_big_fil_rev_8_21_14_0_65_38_15]|nr:MAG: hypothetical protein COW79_15335 [Bdellovibrionales bacterium CG22_combo_CG10-13_8_21_14_all_38_13]PIQ52501.1 MAG: hypothetical protein COW01_16170 [Bdellovibrionales bacterium CG12_big_fil_rev_8_21_14_0_65_38_15]PIR29539.1 MAG: hypothetical protein COV38_10710 [Bdellovibrionales bacterium CG11_big_fil_rev_8_21_14_0_20_38_13]